MTSNPKFRSLIEAAKSENHDGVMIDHDKIMTRHDTIMRASKQASKQEEQERKEASAIADSRSEEKAKKQAPEEAQRLASLLFALHRDQIDPGFRATSAQLVAWALDIDKLNRIDGRAWADIEAAIRWIKVSGCFWAPNILSGKKLREKFATVWGQMQRPSGPAPRVASQSRMLEMGE